MCQACVCLGWKAHALGGAVTGGVGSRVAPEGPARWHWGCRGVETLPRPGGNVAEPPASEPHPPGRPEVGSRCRAGVCEAARHLRWGGSGCPVLTLSLVSPAAWLLQRNWAVCTGALLCRAGLRRAARSNVGPEVAFRAFSPPRSSFSREVSEFCSWTRPFLFPQSVRRWGSSWFPRYSRVCRVLRWHQRYPMPFPCWGSAEESCTTPWRCLPKPLLLGPALRRRVGHPTPSDLLTLRRLKRRFEGRDWCVSVNQVTFKHSHLETRPARRTGLRWDVFRLPLNVHPSLSCPFPEAVLIAPCSQEKGRKSVLLPVALTLSGRALRYSAPVARVKLGGDACLGRAAGETPRRGSLG